jgi:hypothetical protein
MALSKEAAYSLAERKYKQSETEKAAENFRRWIGRDKPGGGFNEEDTNNVVGTDNYYVTAGRIQAEE